MNYIWCKVCEQKTYYDKNWEPYPKNIQTKMCEGCYYRSKRERQLEKEGERLQKI